MSWKRSRIERVVLVKVRHLVAGVRPLAHPVLRKRPWSLRGPRGDGNGDRSPALRSYTQYIRCHLLSLVNGAVLGSCREAASRQNTRQELGPCFNF